MDVVTVDAFAHHERKPIADLTARDFIVRDNGVEQVVDSIGTTDSAHVIIGLDLSGSVDGKTLDQLRAGRAGARRRAVGRRPGVAVHLLRSCCAC